MNPFTHIPHTPADHFSLYFYATVLHVIEQAAQSYDSYEALFETFPFLEGYFDEVAMLGIEADELSALAKEAGDDMMAWEAAATTHLPLAVLREAAHLAPWEITLLFCAGLIEEDARFGLLFDSIQTIVGTHRPTVGLVSAWWRTTPNGTNVRTTLRRLLSLGLVEIDNPNAPRSEWTLQTPTLLWDAARGDLHSDLAPWATYHPPAYLAPSDALIVDAAIHQRLETLPMLLAHGIANALVVRGPQNNGRHTLVGAVARAMGRGLLEIHSLTHAGDERWRTIGPLATMRHALPVFSFELGPGERAEVPQLNGYTGAVAVVLGKQGGLFGASVEQAVTIMLEMPRLDQRQMHWQAALQKNGHALPPPAADDQAAHENASTLDMQLGERFRITGGNIRRMARLAQSYAALDGREQITLEDAQQAGHTLNRQSLELLATYLPKLAAAGGEQAWQHLAVEAKIKSELRTLESRCRNRERLHTAVGATLATQLNAGVRALFAGPSGAGKTLAARVLAASLNKDLYRLDLSAVVNKYIGETEKNLSLVFARAEEMDVILLLDEGDALLTQRTSVSNANDRYANLETNFLLQRLESYEGILLVTTNAADRIDSAFARRMDAVINFRPPDVLERQAIWQLHLPHDHAVAPHYLSEIASRCLLNGGQIRNAALHAALLSLDKGESLTAAELTSAVQREYRKSGTVCPLPKATVSVTNG
jgi:hypothetical protein